MRAETRGVGGSANRNSQRRWEGQLKANTRGLPGRTVSVNRRSTKQLDPEFVLGLLKIVELSVEPHRIPAEGHTGMLKLSDGGDLEALEHAAVLVDGHREAIVLGIGLDQLVPQVFACEPTAHAAYAARLFLLTAFLGWGDSAALNEHARKVRSVA